MVYNIKMGIVAGAGLAGTAITTFSSKMGNSGGSYGNDKNSNNGHGSNNGCSRSSSVNNGGSGSSGWNTSSSKNDDTFRQMHMWKY